ncbi:MAG: phosphoesterase, partial [Bacteroidota bacterium]
FGENYAFVDRTHITRTDIDGSARSFSSFYEFADEAAISRLYGGIHYRAAIELGVEQGIEIGKNIGTLQFR